MWRSILATIGAIAIGVTVRFVYDFWVKPFFSKKDSAKKAAPLTKEELKSLKKVAKAQKKLTKQ